MLPAPPSDLRSVWFLPLAPCAILMALMLMGYQVFQGLATLYNENFDFEDANSLEFGDWLNLGVFAIQAALSLVGLVCIVLRRTRGVAFLVSGYKIVFSALIMHVVTSWITWILIKIGFEDGEDFTRFELFQIILTSAFGVLMVATSYWTFGALLSLVQVVVAGGHGWEYLNAAQVKERRFEKFLVMSNEESKQYGL